jgi:preprotein translocase subunit SecY
MTLELALYLYLLVCLLLVNFFTIFYNGVFRNPDQLLCI